MLLEIDGALDEKLDGVWRSSVNFDGKRIWFETTDAELSSSGEAFGSAVLIPVLLQGLQVRLDKPVCAQWKANASQLTKMLGEVWGCATDLPIACQTVERTASDGRLRAQFFSGGVDSFYELMTAKTPPEALICLQGFDMGLDDSDRFQLLKKTVQQLCSEREIEPIFLRTNIKHHPVVAGVSWDDAHGGVLAAIGHLLSRKVHSVVIPPSWSQSNWRALWGSHWKIDPLWSSKTMSVVHGDASNSRSERIKAIASDPFVQQHLRVCYSSRQKSGNCSQCAKCVRTMAVLHYFGELEKFSVFDHSLSIYDRIDQLPFVSATVTYDELLENGVEPKLESAIRRLIKRSQGVSLRTEYLLAHNYDLTEANQDLEKQLVEVHKTLAAMSNSRVWKAGRVFRSVRRILRSSD